MPTRRQQAAAAKGSPKSRIAGDEPVQIITRDLSKATPTLSPHKPDTKGMETIGNRLRKRCRTDSFPIEDPSLAPKRTQPRKVAEATSKRARVGTSPQSTFHSRNQQPQPRPPSAIGSPLKEDQPGHGQEQGDRPQSTQRVPIPTAERAADYNGIIADILSHGKTIDSRCNSEVYDAMGMVDTESFPPLGASVHLRTQSLPILDNLATQILNIFARSSYREILVIATECDSDAGRAYATLKSLFDHTKKVYSIHKPFLNTYELGLREIAHIDTIKKANVATFVSSVFGSEDVGFYHLNEHFLDTFTADFKGLLKNQAQLFLDLKTQAYIAAIAKGERGREEILADIFPNDLEERLLRRRDGAKQLTPSEMEFVQRARNRHRALLEESSSEEAVKALPEKYVWEDFLRDVTTYVTKNFEAIAGVPAQISPRPHSASSQSTPDQKQNTRGQQNRSQRRPFRSQDLQQQKQKNALDGMPRTNDIAPPHNNNAPFNSTNHISEKSARTADHAMQGFGQDQGAVPPHSPTQHTQKPTAAPTSTPPTLYNREIRYHFENELHPNVPAPPVPHYFQEIQYQMPQQLQQWQGQMGASQLHQSYSDRQLIPNPAQTAPTQVLYERARQAATAKSSPNNRHSGTPGQRRPWTADEENSLMAGLDRVKGPHWSQILAMFGPGGTINEVLKDRNQVQLKDKARNLKLFFLKSNIEVPYYLQFVTGELKTRAPSQAAKNQANKKETSDEDRAHIEGVITLAGGAIPETDQPMDAFDDQAQLSQNGIVRTADMGNGAIDPDIQNGKVTKLRMA